MAIAGNQVAVMSPYEERLATLPSLPRKHLAGDGSEPSGSVEGIASSSATLADASDDVKFKTVEALVRSQDRMTRNDWAVDTHFRRIRSGVPFSRLEKIPNQSIWVAKLPNGMNAESSAAVPNKADDLCNKVEDTLMADPAKPDPMPHVSDEAITQAAKLAAEWLLQDGGEAGTNDTETYRWALNNAFTGASSYLHYVIDTTGGGYQPTQLLAHPLAADPANPMEAVITVPQSDPTQPPMQVTERATDPILRYVSAPSEQAPAGQFVDSADQADRTWLPKVIIERMRREQVRCYPPTATVENAKAMILIRFPTLQEARSMWPETVGSMSMEDLGALASWKPAQSDIVVPYAFRGLQEGMTGPSLDEVGSLSPLLQRRMFCYRLYVAKAPEYPAGYQLDISGANGGTVLGESDMEYTVTLPTQGKTTRCKDIPVVQIRPMQDVDGGNPKGWPFISRFAGASEAESTLYSAFMDICDNMLHPHVFIHSTASVDDDDWFDRSVPIILHPNDKPPTYEQFPNLPPILPLIENLDVKQDTISGLTSTAQGLDSSNSISGVAKNLTIRQALISLSGFQQNLHAGMTRGWRIKCQLAQAEFTTAQLIEYAGTASSQQPTWWTGEDFAGVDRIGIQPGTGSMMTPEGKAQYVAFLQSQQWLAPDQAAAVALPGIKMDLGLPEDPYEASIEREVAAWLQGPTDEWNAASQQQEQVTAQAQTAYQQQTAAVAPQYAAQGLQPPTFVPPVQAPLPTPFTPRPNDAEPAKATVVMKRLSKLFEDPQYAKFPPAWQALPVVPYQTAVQALQPPPQLPHGVTISAKGDASNIAGEEQAAIAGVQKGGQPGQPQTPQAPQGPAPKAVPLPKPMGA